MNFLAPAYGEKLVARGEVVTAGRLFVCRGVRRRGAGRARVRGHAADGFALARAGSGPQARSLRDTTPMNDATAGTKRAVAIS